MSEPTPKEARQREAIVAARLRNMTPIWARGSLKLYLGNDGHYIVHITGVNDYLGITPDGEVLDLAGYKLSSSDCTKAQICLKGAGQHVVERRLRERYRDLLDKS